MTARRETARGFDVRDPQIAVALALGAVLALIGILAPVVSGQEGPFLGFGRNYLHDAVHLVTGLAGLAAGYYAGGRFAREYNLAMGAAYALVVVLGFVAFDLMNDVLALNTADNFLHLGLTIVFLGVGYLAGRR